MLLASRRLATTDVSSLRIVQSGGEKVPYAPTADFEERTQSRILQFYGSNEAGCVCGTTLADPIQKRLGTAGRIFPETHVRLFDDDDNDVTATGVGRCACKGPGITPGYYGNDEANAKLFRPDGWMYLGDIVEIDQDDYLSVVGRTADFIIRGGHNISAPAVEEEILAHPRIGMAAVVAMPDPVVGERVCAYIVTDDGGDLSVEDLAAFLAAEGVSKTMWPERIVVVGELPRAAGAKVAKAELRVDIERRMREEAAAGQPHAAPE
jgi:acyl-CoA synthetase